VLLSIIGMSALMGLFYRLTPDKSVTLRHVYGLVFGFIFQFLMFREKIVFWWGSQTVAWILMQLMGAKSVLFVWAWLMITTDMQHGYQYIYHYLAYWQDLSLVLMLGFMKVTSFAFSYADGQMTPKELNTFVGNISKNPKA